MDRKVTRRAVFLGMAALGAGLPGMTLAEVRFPGVAWGAREKSMLNRRPLLGGAGLAVPPPPLPGSDEARAELVAIEQAQAAGLAPAVAPSAAELLHRPMIEVLQGRGVVPEAVLAPKLVALLEMIDADITLAAARAAQTHARVSPHVVSPRIEDLAGAPQMAAFPSVAFSRISAAVSLLAALGPACGEDYDRILAQAARDLVETGAHRRSDITAASVLSSGYLAAVLTMPSVAQLLPEAKVELGVHQRLRGCRLTRG